MRKAFLAASLLALSAVAPVAHAAPPLSEPAKEALLAALDDEYRANAVYVAVMEKFGRIRPFVNIAEAEIRHSDAVKDALVRYGVDVPANPYLDGSKALPELPGTVQEACALGVQAEIENRDLYDKNLLPKAAGYPDIVQVLTSLRDASQQKHLPAFERCASGRMGGGKG